MGTVAVDPGRACPARWIVLVAVDGLGTNDIARRTGVPMPMVILWRSASQGHNHSGSQGIIAHISIRLSSRYK